MSVCSPRRVKGGLNWYQHSFVPSEQWAVHFVEASWNVMAHAQKPDFIFRRNGWVHLNRRRRQFSRLLAAGVYVSAVVMLDTPCAEVVWRVLATHSISQFPLHFPSLALPCAIAFQLESTTADFPHKRVTTVPIEQEAGWAPETFWTFFKRGKLLSLVRIEGRLQVHDHIGSPCSRW